MRRAVWIFLAASLAIPARAGYLGVGAIELPDNRGIEVTSIGRDSPAEKAGIKAEDVIVELNGKAVDDVAQFIHAIGQMQAGAKVNLTLVRGGTNRKIAAALESRPENAFAPLPPVRMPPMSVGGPFPIFLASSALIGFEGETLSPQLAEFFGVKEGVLVRTVGTDTPAEKAGLKAGDVGDKGQRDANNHSSRNFGSGEGEPQKKLVFYGCPR